MSRGFTLVELLLTLGALSALAAAAFLVYPAVMAEYRGKVDREFLSAASTNITSAFQGAQRFGPYHDTDVSFLSDLQYSGQLAWALPGELCRPWSEASPVPYLCTDAFGHPFFWSTMATGNPDGTWNPFQLQATFSDLSPDECIQLLRSGVSAYGAQQIEIIRAGQPTICVQPFNNPAELVSACTGGNLPGDVSGFVDEFQIEWDPWGRPFWMTPE